MRLIFIELLVALVLLPISGLFWWWAFGMGGLAVAGFLLVGGHSHGDPLACPGGI